MFNSILIAIIALNCALTYTLLAEEAPEPKIETELVELEGPTEPQKPILMKGYTSQIRQIVSRLSTKYGLEEAQLACILQIESQFKLSAVSATGDYGMGQVNKLAWPTYKPELLTTDLEYSIDATASILAHYKERRAEEEPRTWISRYNVGPSSFTTVRNGVSVGALAAAYLVKYERCYVNYYSNVD